MNIKPLRILPGNVYALMWGKSLRFEYTDGSGSLWLSKDKSRLFYFFGATNIIKEGKTLVLTHLQKKMKWGIFITTGWKSWGFHFWYHWHMQEFQDENAYTPNSERGVYFRLPGYRWDIEEGMIFTGGRVPGAHWD